MINWICFVISIIILYSGTYLINRYFVENDDRSKKVNEEIEKLKQKRLKTVDEQKRYLDLIEDKKNLYGGAFERAIFLILTILIFVFTISKIPGNYKILYFFLYISVMPFFYFVINEKFKLYNYLTNINMLFFIGAYITIQTIDPMMIYDHQLRLIYILPVLVIVNYFVPIQNK